MINLIKDFGLIEPCVDLINLGQIETITKGSALLATAAVTVGVMALKAGLSAIGVGKKKREKKKKEAELKEQMAQVEDFEFTNSYEGLEGASYDVTKGELGTLGSANQLGDAGQYEIGEKGTGRLSRLASAKGYTSGGYTGEGYTSQGYSAGQTNIAGLSRGANTGLTNNFNNLQVSTAAAEMQGQETDQALAASQDLAAQAGTGAGGATALAAAAAKSKQGIASTIDQQVMQNEKMRAGGEQELQRAQLAQGNLASQFDIGQSQFNVGSVNTAAQFGAQSANQAAQFGAGARNEANRFTADAENQASRFKAQAQNTFAMSEFTEGNRMSQFNAGAQNAAGMANTAAQNKFDMANVASQNQYGLAEYQAGNDMSKFNAGAQTGADAYAASSGYDAQKTIMGGDAAVQNNQYNKEIALLNVAGGQAAGAANALASQNAAIYGAVGDVASSAGTAANNYIASKN